MREQVIPENQVESRSKQDSTRSSGRMEGRETAFDVVVRWSVFSSVEERPRAKQVKGIEGPAKESRSAKVGRERKGRTVSTKLTSNDSAERYGS